MSRVSRWAGAALATGTGAGLGWMLLLWATPCTAGALC